MPFSSYGAPLHVPWEFYFNMHYPYPPWSYNSYMPFPPRYFCPDYITYKESVIKKSPLANNDCFIHKNRSVQKKKHKVTKQVYRVKKDGRLTKNSDLTLEKGKPIIEETSVSSIDQIASDVEHASNDIAEQQLSSAVGQEQKRDTRSAGLTGSSGSVVENPSNKSKAKPSFKELLTKYEKEGAAQKQRRWSNKVKDVKSTSTSGEQSNHSPCQGNCGAMQYSGPVAPWFWPNPCYYMPLDYNIMHMQPYGIQYPISYSKYGSSQRPITANNNLAKIGACAKQCENNSKQGSKNTQPRWCPLGLSHTQKRRLQRMRKKESMEQQAEVVPARSATMKQVWRAKQVVSSSA